MKITELIKSYLNEYNEKEHPFLLFDMAHVNENDHTRVLQGILKYNNCQFLPSFLKMIGAPEYKEGGKKPQPTVQEKAIGNDGTGFIDLYFEYNTVGGEKKVIIENKINNASDTRRQLERYIATALNISFDEFKKPNWYINKKFSNVYVVYLTADGAKEPDNSSFPDELKKMIGNCYSLINYNDDILPWLENDVLPNMPYSDDGIAIAGVRQYIESLKAMFSNKGDSQVIKKYVENLNGSVVEKYKKIKETINSIKCISEIIKNKAGKSTKNLANAQNEVEELKKAGIDVENLQLQPLLHDLRVAINDLFSNKMPVGWNLYFTPSFILLYKDSWWSETDIKKGYNYPSIHLNCSPTDNLFYPKKNITWRIKADHLPTNTNMPDLNEEWQFEGQRNRTISMMLKDVKTNHDNVETDDGLILFFKSVIAKIQNMKTITYIDTILADAKNNKELYQLAVLNKLAAVCERKRH